MKKNYTSIPFIICVLISISSAHAQWSKIADLPYSADGAGSFNVNGKLYVAGGANTGVINKLYMYDDANDQWIKKADMPRAKSWAFSFAVNNRIYIAGGDTTFTTLYPSKDMWVYDPATDMWTQKSDMPDYERLGGFCFVLNNKVYIGGGATRTSITNDVYMYDPATDKWTQNGVCPEALLFPAYFTLNGKGYLGTGDGGNGETGTFYEFDPANNKWTKLNDFTGQTRQEATGFASGTNGYIAGGHQGFSKTINTIYQYNPATDSWQQFGMLPFDHVVASTSVVINNTLYIGTGAKFSGTTYGNSFYKYELPVGINDPDNSSARYQVYPLPAANTLNISEVINAGSITITDLNGKKAMNKKVNAGTNAIDISSIPPGMYILMITDKGGVYKTTFTIER